MTHPSEVAQFQSLNRLLALAAGSDPDLTRQLDAALAFSLGNGHYRGQAAESTAEWAVRALVDFHSGGCGLVGLGVCNLAGEPFDPLFFHARVLETLERLAGYHSAVLAIIGLRRALCQPGRRWTRTLSREHAAAIELANALALRECDPAAVRHLVFV
jgi:hypothetical protein